MVFCIFLIYFLILAYFKKKFLASIFFKLQISLIASYYKHLSSLNQMKSMILPSCFIDSKEHWLG